MIERNAGMLSDRIYSIRQQYHYSQEKFAEKLGVSRQAVQRWENGTSVPDIGSIINIATTFNVSSDWLMEISKFGKLSSGHRTGEGQFSSQSQRKAIPKNVQTTP